MVNESELLALWREEEKIAHIHGWDFSHIHGRYAEKDRLPWDYRQAILEHLKPGMKLLDVDTGGGEFLLTLKHPYGNTAASEGYPPNIRLCGETLLPLGIDFRPGEIKEGLPFADASFDIILNRHGDLNGPDTCRMLKPGGLFITQQVGAENDRELAELLIGRKASPFPEQYLEIARKKLTDSGFEILVEQESFDPIRFYDIGALVWFARIISWEFPGFSVDTHGEQLLKAQRILQEKGYVEGTTHRFFLIAQKKTGGTD